MNDAIERAVEYLHRELDKAGAPKEEDTKQLHLEDRIAWLGKRNKELEKVVLDILTREAQERGGYD